MAVRTKNGRHTVEFMYRGNRIFRRLPAGRTKGEAQALEARLRSALFHQIDLGRPADPLVEDVIHAWYANRKDPKLRSHANAVLANLPGHPALSELSSVRDHLVKLWKDLAPGTVNRRLSVLKASAKYAFRAKLCPRNWSAEVEMLREPSYTRREVAPWMAQRLIRNASSKRAKALIAGSAFTGMRLSEVLRFDPAKDIEGDVIRVRDQKSGGDRLIPLPDELKPYLSQFPMTANWRNVYRGFEAARKRAKLTIRYHDLRHMVATAMAEAGVHPRTMADILGHKSTSTTAKYTHPSMKAKREALKAITSQLHQGPAKKAA